MEGTSTSKLVTARQLGIFFGIIMILEMVLMYVAHISPAANPSVGLIMNLCNYLILPVIFIVMACKAYKNANDGFISFGECIKTGVLLCVIAAAIWGVGYAIFNAIVPEYKEEAMEISRTAMLEQNPDMTEEQMEMGISMMEKFMSPWILLPFSIVIYALIGLIYSAIIGAIVKRDRPQGI